MHWVAKLKEKYFRTRPVDLTDDLKRLINEYRLGRSEYWAQNEERIYERFADNFRAAFEHFLNGDNAQSWNTTIRCFENWAELSGPDRALAELKARKFSEEKINSALDEMDLSMGGRR